MPYCFLNGSILPVSEAKVGVYDIGLLRGFGIYEALVVHGGKPFRFEDHMARFRRSAGELDISIPQSDEEISVIILELAERNGLSDAVVRIILTGGEAKGGIEYDPTTPTFCILLEPLVPLPEHYSTEGCSLMTQEHQRQFSSSKTTNYIQAVMLQRERVRRGALEILYTSEGKVLECATSNFFIVKNGTVITPKEDVLDGITHKVVLELARQHFPTEEREVLVEELNEASEAFLTSSFKDIVPVVRVDDIRVGGGAVGPVTKELMRLFHAYVEGL